MKQNVEPHPRIVERDAVRYVADDPSAGSNIEAIMARISAQVTADAYKLMTCKARTVPNELCSNAISESTRQVAAGVVRCRGS